MKKFLLSFYIVLSFLGHAQKYLPIDSNMVWNESSTIKKYQAGNQCCYQLENSSFQFEGFVLNNGNVWFKLFKSALYSWNWPTCTCNSSYLNSNFTNAHIGYVLNDSLNKKVYFTPTLTANFVPGSSEIVYDFLNKNVGDSLWWRPVWISSSQMPLNKYKILSIDSLLFSGKYHKKFVIGFNPLNFTYPLWVVEGIGSFRGAWNTYFSDFEGGSSLGCFSDQQEARSVTSPTSCNSMPTAVCGIINIAPQVEAPIFSIHPNPVSNQLSIENIQYENLIVIDVFGKIVLEQDHYSAKISVQQLQTGLYFLKLRSGSTIYASKFLKE